MSGVRRNVSRNRSGESNVGRSDSTVVFVSCLVSVSSSRIETDRASSANPRAQPQSPGTKAPKHKNTQHNQQRDNRAAEQQTRRDQTTTNVRGVCVYVARACTKKPIICVIYTKNEDLNERSGGGGHLLLFCACACACVSCVRQHTRTNTHTHTPRNTHLTCRVEPQPICT